jgi:hypothetical protein
MKALSNGCPEKFTLNDIYTEVHAAEPPLPGCGRRTQFTNTRRIAIPWLMRGLGSSRITVSIYVYTHFKVVTNTISHKLSRNRSSDRKQTAAKWYTNSLLNNSRVNTTCIFSRVESKASTEHRRCYNSEAFSLSSSVLAFAAFGANCFCFPSFLRNFSYCFLSLTAIVGGWVPDGTV